MFLFRASHLAAPSSTPGLNMEGYGIAMAAFWNSVQSFASFIGGIRWVVATLTIVLCVYMSVRWWNQKQVSTQSK